MTAAEERPGSAPARAAGGVAEREEESGAEAPFLFATASQMMQATQGSRCAAAATLPALSPPPLGFAAWQQQQQQQQQGRAAGDGESMRSTSAPVGAGQGQGFWQAGARTPHVGGAGGSGGGGWQAAPSTAGASRPNGGWSAASVPPAAGQPWAFGQGPMALGSQQLQQQGQLSGGGASQRAYPSPLPVAYANSQQQQQQQQQQDSFGRVPSMHSPFPTHYPGDGGPPQQAQGTLAFASPLSSFPGPGAVPPPGFYSAPQQQPCFPPSSMQPSGSCYQVYPFPGGPPSTHPRPSPRNGLHEAHIHMHGRFANPGTGGLHQPAVPSDGTQHSAPTAAAVVAGGVAQPTSSGWATGHSHPYHRFGPGAASLPPGHNGSSHGMQQHQGQHQGQRMQQQHHQPSEKRQHQHQQYQQVQLQQVQQQPMQQQARQQWGQPPDANGSAELGPGEEGCSFMFKPASQLWSPRAPKTGGQQQQQDGWQ